MSLTNINDDIAATLRTRRDALRLTQREAADVLGVSERTIQNWEAGVSFPRAKHRRALDAFFAEPVAA